jgi:FkbM family methyltransferase
MIDFIAKVSRALPSFRGKYRVLRFLWQRTSATHRDVIVRGRDNIIYLLPNVTEVIGFSIFINGVYENEFSDYFIKNIPQGGVFVDAGANIGSICIRIAKKRPDVTILAVEASPKVFGYLEHNVRINNCINIQIINKALSSVSNETIQFYSPDELFGKGSMSPVFTQDGETVKTVTVDDLLASKGLSRIDMMKIDVEGYEKMVFEGMNDLFLNKRVTKIVFEFVDWAEKAAGYHAGAAQQFLQENGFELALMDNKKITPVTAAINKGSAMLLANVK